MQNRVQRRNTDLVNDGHIILMVCLVLMLPCFAAVLIKEDPGQQPHHKVGMQLDSMETGIQYMGSSILMASLSHLEVALHDEWRRQEDDEEEEVCDTDESPPTATPRSFLVTYLLYFRRTLLPSALSRYTIRRLSFTQLLTSVIGIPMCLDHFGIYIVFPAIW